MRLSMGITGLRSLGIELHSLYWLVQAEALTCTCTPCPPVGWRTVKETLNVCLESNQFLILTFTTVCCLHVAAASTVCSTEGSDAVPIILKEADGQSGIMGIMAPRQ